MSDDYLTISSGEILGEYELKLALENSVLNNQETVLVAPNKRLQKQWRKDYPGIKVILQTEYKGYPLPTELTSYLGVQAKENRSK